MTGGENVYKYITTEGKVAGKKTGKITALEYLQKSTGVFNGDGLLSEEKVAEMKERLKTNKGNINVIILMFGFGMVAHLAVSLTEEKILKSRLLKNSSVVQSEKTA